MAERVRFSGDTMRANNDNIESSMVGIKNRFYQTDLRISQEVTPALFDTIKAVCGRLYVPPDLVEAFVYSSSEFQAECFSGSKHECVLRFSSSLVDILDDREFGFVVGHELGHFLFGHGISRVNFNQSSLEFFIQQRFQEISVDRIGLIACGSLEVSIRALMKTVSGLNSRHLRFDIGSFISQIRHATTLENNETASHPSMLVRCRALLWFSLSEFFQKDINRKLDKSLLGLDERIRKDFHRYIDGPIIDKIESAKNDLKMWLVAYNIVKENVFSKVAQRKFSSEFGDDALASFKSYLEGIPLTKVNDEVYSRVVSARETLEILIPEGFGSALSEINKWVESSSWDILSS